MWGISSGECFKKWQGHTGHVYAVVFSPDGSRIASAGDAFGRVWDANTLEQKLILEGHHGYVNQLAFTSDGSRIVSCSNDETVRVWDAATGASIKVINAKVGEIAKVWNHVRAANWDSRP